MKRYLEAHVPSVGSELHELGGERLVVGTGPHATLRVHPGSGLEARALELVVQPEGVRVTAAAGARDALVFDGAGCREALVPWGGEIYVGGTRLVFLERGEGRGGALPLLALAAVALLGVPFALRHLEPAAASSRAVEAPPLVAGEVACAQQGASAEHRARQAEAAARAKEERFPFARKDGAEALVLYRESRACYAGAGLEADAARVAAELERWSGRMNEEYAALRLRLRLALDQGRQQDALTAVRGLEALLGRRPDDAYAGWLEAVRRELERKAARRGR